MNEIETIRKILVSDDFVKISLLADLEIEKISASKYKLRKFGVGKPPNYNMILEISEDYFCETEVAERFVNLRYQYNIGFDFQHREYIDE